MVFITRITDNVQVDPRRRRLPAVFSHFRKRVEADLPSRKILPAPDAGELAPLPPGLEEGNLPTIEYVFVPVSFIGPDSYHYVCAHLVPALETT